VTETGARWAADRACAPVGLRPDTRTTSAARQTAASLAGKRKETAQHAKQAVSLIWDVAELGMQPLHLRGRYFLCLSLAELWKCQPLQQIAVGRGGRGRTLGLHMLGKELLCDLGKG
jgi:hypothetical protein